MTQPILFLLFACGDEPDPKTKDIVEDTANDTDVPVEQCDITCGTVPVMVADLGFTERPCCDYLFKKNPTVAFSVTDSAGSEVPVSFT